jgi:hypothetical protein
MEAPPSLRARSFATGLLAILALAGCGGGSPNVAIVPVVAPSSTHATTAVGRTHQQPTLNNPAQQPDAQTTLACGDAPAGHACVGGPPDPGNPNQFPQRNCDTNIVANSLTSCGLAENTFYEYYAATRAGGGGTPATRAGGGGTLRVHSPSTGRDYAIACAAGSTLVTCVADPLSTGVFVSFPGAAVAAYTQAEAAAYASTHDVGTAPTNAPGPPPGPHGKEHGHDHGHGHGGPHAGHHD